MKEGKILNSTYNAMQGLLRPGEIETVKFMETIGKSGLRLRKIHLDNTRWLSVCALFEVSAEEIKSKSRTRKFVLARQTLCYLYDLETDLTWKQMGQLIGGRDHSTAIHSVEAISNLMDSDAEFRLKIIKLENR